MEAMEKADEALGGSVKAEETEEEKRLRMARENAENFERFLNQLPATDRARAQLGR